MTIYIQTTFFKAILILLEWDRRIVFLFFMKNRVDKKGSLQVIMAYFVERLQKKYFRPYVTRCFLRRQNTIFNERRRW
jgi:hypothetical protein